MSTLTLDGQSLIWRTPYDPALVAELKAQVPASDRQWDPSRKAWRVATAHGALLCALTERHLGERLSMPLGVSLSKTQTRIIDARYIGATKDRGGDTRSAYAWCDGGWSVLFPESVLRDWFEAPARPDEETTLYQVLAVKRDADAQALKTAYRRLSKQWHPDVCHEPGASEVFKRINAAYNLLTDPAKRARYDAGLALTATLGVQLAAVELFSGYRSPLRCGLLMVEGVQRLKFVVEKILAWEDIFNDQGLTLSVSWPLGADKFVETWI